VEELDPAREDALCELWRENLPAVSGDLHAKLRWTYRTGPDGPGTVLLLVAKNGAPGTVVGCAGLLARGFSSHGRDVRLGLNCDFAVDKHHRSGMPAILLQRAMYRRARAAFPLSYGFPNDKAIGIFERLGYHKLGPLTRFARVLHYERYVRRVVEMRGATRVAGLALDWLSRVRHAPRTWPARLALRLEWLVGFDERFDALWRQAGPAWPIVGCRDAAHLNWRFRDRPGASYDIAAVRDRRGGALVGYVVLERHGPGAHVRDLFARDDEALGQVLELVADQLRERGCDSLSVAFLGARRVGEILEGCSFRAREIGRTVIIDVGEGAPMPSEALRRPDSWYLTDADEDT
jgi:hypothetical protein